MQSTIRGGTKRELGLRLSLFLHHCSSPANTRSRSAPCIISLSAHLLGDWPHMLGHPLGNEKGKNNRPQLGRWGVHTCSLPFS